MKKRFKGKSKRKSSETAVPVDPHDRVVLQLPCYEPAGQFVEITEGELLRHVLLTGQTGAGKSSTLNGILADLIGYRAYAANARPGLVIMDNQNDDTILKVRHLAAKVNRQDDVLHLSPDSGWYRPLGELKSWADLDRATGRLISASRFMEESGGNNYYWSETSKLLLESCLIVMLVTSRQEVRFSEVLQFLSHWLISGKEVPPKVANRMKLFQAVVDAAKSSLSPAIESKMTFALSALRMWDALDPRTKSILRSCIATVLGPFLSVSGLRYWDEGRGARVDPALVLEGKIVVISVPAAVEPELATVLGRLVKADFYEANQRRSYKPGDRIVAMIQDEYPYSITAGSSRWSDITNLATLRARGACLIAATQGLANLGLVVGAQSLNALLLNFSNLFFFRSQEPALDRWTEQIFGFKTPKNSKAKEPQAGFWPSPALEEIVAAMRTPVPEYCCPRGALARLQTHQAFISLANGTVTQEPLWLAPNHLNVVAAPPPPAAVDRDMEIITETRNQLSPPQDPDELPF